MSCCQINKCPKGDRGNQGPRGTPLGYAEYIESSDSNSTTNTSIGLTGFSEIFTISNEVINSVDSGITTLNSPSGTIFSLKYPGTYEVSYEFNLESNVEAGDGGQVALAFGDTSMALIPEPASIAGVTINGSWLHGKYIFRTDTPIFMCLLNSNPDTINVANAGPDEALRVIRLTIVHISQ